MDHTFRRQYAKHVEHLRKWLRLGDENHQIALSLIMYQSPQFGILGSAKLSCYKFHGILLAAALLQGVSSFAQGSAIEKAESSWKSYAECDFNVLADPKLSHLIYQSDRAVADKAEKFLRDYSIANFGEADARALENRAYIYAAVIVYKPNRSYEQLTQAERRERLQFCRGLFEHFAKGGKR